MPADAERWQAYLTDDEPPELAFFCQACAGARVRSRLALDCVHACIPLTREDVEAIGCIWQEWGVFVLDHREDLEHAAAWKLAADTYHEQMHGTKPPETRPARSAP